MDTASRDALKKLRELVDKQAEDPGLWFTRQASVTYLQQALRKLHAAIEAAQPGMPSVPKDESEPEAVRVPKGRSEP